MYPGDLSLIAYLVVWSVEGLFAHYYAEKSVLLDMEGQKKAWRCSHVPMCLRPKNGAAAGKGR